MAARGKPQVRNGLYEQVRDSSQRLARSGQIVRTVVVQPGEPFRRQPGDFLIRRLTEDQTVRGKEKATELALQRSPGATYVGADSRFFCFRPAAAKR